MDDDRLILTTWIILYVGLDFKFMECDHILMLDILLAFIIALYVHQQIKYY